MKTSPALRPLEELLVALTDRLLLGAGGADVGAAVQVVGMDLDLPVELRIGARELRASLPRTRLAAGFAVPHGRLRVRFDVVEAREEGS